MAKWNKEKTVLKESNKNTQRDITSMFQQPFYHFASQLSMVKGQQVITSTVKQAMLKDPIVTQIINMWISDTLSKDVLSNEMFEVKIKSNASSGITDERLNDIKNNLDYLRENSNIESQLTSILYSIITNGIISTRLGFVDRHEDMNIKLFESNKNKVLKETQGWSTEESKKLLEASNYDDYENRTESYIFRQRQNNQRLMGRYYLEILPQKLVPLNHKGISILYLDLNNPTKVLSPKNITTFVNTRGGVKTLSIKEEADDIESTLYEIPLGRSFIEQSVTPWSLYNTVQDCTILALMTRSSIYRIFTIDVGAMDTKATDALMADFKKRLTTRETFDVRSQHYSSAQTQVPLGDSIFIPLRNGTGDLNVQTVGGDLNIQTEGPMKFFRQEFLASLGIAESLVYGDQNGGLINTSATRSDIRYLRTIEQFTSILSLGLEGIFKDFLKMLGIDLSGISLTVVFSKLNSEEQNQKMEYEQKRQEALDRTISSLNNLGIEFSDGKYTTTRNTLITRFMDEELLSAIKKDEGFEDPKLSITHDKDIEEDVEPDRTSSLPTGGDFIDDELPEVPELDEETEPDVEPSEDTEVNEDPPYSVG